MVVSPDGKVIVAGHGPFAWGTSAMEAVRYAAALEEVARMAILTYQVNPAVAPLPEHVMRKHYERKHGVGAYYGQKLKVTVTRERERRSTPRTPKA